MGSRGAEGIGAPVGTSNRAGTVRDRESRGGDGDWKGALEHLNERIRKLVARKNPKDETKGYQLKGALYHHWPGNKIGSGRTGEVENAGGRARAEEMISSWSMREWMEWD